MTGGYPQISHVKVVFCYLGDCLGREYPRDQVFSAHFDHFFVQVMWNKVSVCGRVRSEVGKNKAKYRVKCFVLATLDKFRMGSEPELGILDINIKGVIIKGG